VEIEVGANPFDAQWRENLLDDLSNAHTRIDDHQEQSDEWLHDFEARMQTNGNLAKEMYHTVVDLKSIVEQQQQQIEELQAIVNYCHNRHPSEEIASRALG
jgi:hypothetical protein